MHCVDIKIRHKMRVITIYTGVSVRAFSEFVFRRDGQLFKSNPPLSEQIRIFIDFAKNKIHKCNS